MRNAVPCLHCRGGLPCRPGMFFAHTSACGEVKTVECGQSHIRLCPYGEWICRRALRFPVVPCCKHRGTCLLPLVVLPAQACSCVAVAVVIVSELFAHLPWRALSRRHSCRHAYWLFMCRGVCIYVQTCGAMDLQIRWLHALLVAVCVSLHACNRQKKPFKVKLWAIDVLFAKSFLYLYCL